MTLRENAVASLESRTGANAELLDEYDNDDELFYVGVTDTDLSDDELMDAMKDALNAHDDVMQTIEIAQDVDLENLGVNRSDYHAILRVGHTLS